MITDISILETVAAERDRQLAKWGDQHHTQDRWVTILVEEVGEVARAIQESDTIGYEQELAEVAAVAVAAIRDWRRYNWDTST